MFWNKILIQHLNAHPWCLVTSSSCHLFRILNTLWLFILLCHPAATVCSILNHSVTVYLNLPSQCSSLLHSVITVSLLTTIVKCHHHFCLSSSVITMLLFIVLCHHFVTMYSILSSPCHCSSNIAITMSLLIVFVIIYHILVFITVFLFIIFLSVSLLIIFNHHSVNVYYPVPPQCLCFL